MKVLKLVFLPFVLICSIFLVQSCSKDSSCDGIVCENDGICENGQCECPEGYSGVHCEVVDLCVTQGVECQNGGTCIDGNCECPEGYLGDNCEIEDLCITQAIECQYDGFCEEGECVCVELTMNYLVGNWTFLSGSSAVFGADGTYVFDGNVFTYVAIPETQTIQILWQGEVTYIWTLWEDDISCNHFYYTSDSWTGVNKLNRN